MRYLFALVAFTLTVTSCRFFQPDSTGGRVIQCAGEAIERNWHQALPAVNTCITVDANESGWRDCLIGVINPAVGITEDLVACVLRDQGQKMAAQAERNPNDFRSERGAKRAETWIAERKYTFADGR